jgi:hypothetical protein
MSRDVKIMHEHQRQFVMGPTPLKAYPDWKSETVEGVGFLSHCPKLPAQKVVSKDRGEDILIGIPIQSDPSRPSPIDDLNNPPAWITDLTDTWAGQWE